MSIDHFFFKTYDKVKYNCLHFSDDVWFYVTGERLGERLKGLLEGGLEGRRFGLAHRRSFQRLERPVSPCLALMQSPRMAPHVGVYLEGKVLHIGAKGVEYLPVSVAFRGASKISFYK